jgi:hypothetical protein
LWALILMTEAVRANAVLHGLDAFLWPTLGAEDLASELR